MTNPTVPSAACLPFDKSLLPPCDAEIALISDGHYALPDAPSSAEFPSRLKQGRRLGVALDLLAALQAPLQVHLGDLTQEPPESPLYQTARANGFALFQQRGIVPVWVPGNHDVGDKPDPTMAADPVSETFLTEFEQNFGPSWSLREAGGVCLLFLNSQILSSGLPAEQRQREWLEEELRARRGGRFILFLHLPPYVGHPEEPALGHYDNLPRAERRWLLGLCREFNIELVLSGHVHQRFLNRWGSTTLMTCASPAFTRPGYSHLFSSAPPPEQGRDDCAKEGIHFLRLRPGKTEVHFIRTGGATTLEDAVPVGAVPILTPLASDLPDPRLGITLLHPLSVAVDLPIAWQSSVRMPAHNDYPSLALQELAPGFVRAPVSDLTDPLQSEHLRLLRENGTRVEVFHLWDARGEENLLPANLTEIADGLEIQIPGRLPDAAVLRQVADLVRPLSVPVRLSPVFPGEQVPGKQHRRTRYAWLLEELAEVEAVLEKAAFTPEALLVQPPRGACIQEWSTAFADQKSRFRLDAAVEFQTGDDQAHVQTALTALLAAYRRPDSRLYVQPLQDFDRTMDSMHGLLDGLCNPRPVFIALKFAQAFAASGRLKAETQFLDAPAAEAARKRGVPLLDLLRGCFPSESHPCASGWYLETGDHAAGA